MFEGGLIDLNHPGDELMEGVFVFEQVVEGEFLHPCWLGNCMVGLDMLEKRVDDNDIVAGFVAIGERTGRLVGAMHLTQLRLDKLVVSAIKDLMSNMHQCVAISKLFT